MQRGATSRRRARCRAEAGVSYVGVVYCQPLSGNLFALGLEILTRTAELMMRSSV